MMELSWGMALLGGVLIGISVSLMLYWNGRVTGISGIINGLLTPIKGDIGWRVSFVVGLFSGGLILRLLRPEVFENTLDISMPQTVIAGLLVGFGTVLGSGCTSGHGVCGISRLSRRSLLATVVFMIAGIGTVTILRKWGFWL